MTTKIEFTDKVVFGETEIDAINVEPLNFVNLSRLWLATAAETRGTDSAATAAMQRLRMMHQVHFLSQGKRIPAETNGILRLPISVAKKILAALDVGEGVAGKMLNDGDGMNAPAHYKLGTPIETVLNREKVVISELEFRAEVYGDIEDVLATDGEVPQALALIRKVAQPVGLGSFTSLPGWAVDKITVADGVTIMSTVLPRFLG